MATAEEITDVTQLAFDANGLIPAIAQDTDGRILMVGWMKEESVRETLSSRRMTYWSRSRRSRWVKGETSGDVQDVVEARYDCDADVLLFTVRQHGSGACHTGEYSCFYRTLPLGDAAGSE